MFAYMAAAVMREKESLRAIQLTRLAFIALKSWTYQLVTHVGNLLKIETPLNAISVWKKYI